jgi:hypothetical protein
MSLRSLCFALAVCASTALLSAKAAPAIHSHLTNSGETLGRELLVQSLDRGHITLPDSQPATFISQSPFDETRYRRLASASSFDPPQPLLLPNPRKLSPLDEAYLDVFSVLARDNRCSRWYGGPPALEVLNGFRQRIRLSHLDRQIAFEMKGTYAVYSNAITHISYRMFARTEVNLDGSFYRANRFHNEPKVSPVGLFLPSTREARMLVLLHEMAHLIRQPDGRWLVPDDGDSNLLSNRNTQFVLAQCNEEIRNVARVSVAQEWAMLQKEVANAEAGTARSPTDSAALPRP